MTENFVAKYSYTGSKDDELSFSKGDTLTLINSDQEGWYLMEDSSGMRGLAPANYFKSQKKKKRKKKKGEPAPAPAPIAAAAAAAEEEEESEGEGEGVPMTPPPPVYEEDEFPCPLCSQMVSFEQASGHQCSAAAAVVTGDSAGDADQWKARAVELEKQLAALMAAVESERKENEGGTDDLLQRFQEERKAHAAAVERASELADLLKKSQKKQSKAEAELAALKKKTSRMVKLFTEQKKVLEDKVKQAGSSGSGSSASSEELMRLQQQNDRLMRELDELRSAGAPAVTSGGDEGQPPPPPPPGPAPPPPPKPIVLNRGAQQGAGGMFDSIKGGVQLKKAPKRVPAAKKKPVGGQMGGMAAMVAQIANQRKQNNKRIDAQMAFARTSLGRK